MLKMKSALAAIGLSVVAATSWAADITGAGATFPYPIYAKWAEAYSKIGQARINYQPIGSGAGIQQLTSKTVDFAGSDSALTLAANPSGAGAFT